MSELSDDATLHTDRVVVMLHPRKAVLRSAIRHRQLADHADPLQELDGPKTVARPTPGSSSQISSAVNPSPFCSNSPITLRLGAVMR